MTKRPERKRIPRTDSFFGVHFDFHAGMDCTEIGRTVTPAMIGRMLDLIRPDYVQCDCKGHPGVASYPTKIGTPAPGFVRDPLRIWRAETAKRGVALFVHYSGVWDAAACAAHPEWARVDAEGKPDLKKTSVFGRYIDDLLIPQLLELYDTYGIDGVWIDGDCWACELDYAPAAVDAWRQETGTEPPRAPTDPAWPAYRNFNRDGFRRSLRHYVSELKRRAPQLQVTSNWAFSSQMPEAESAGLAFLSGDYPLADSYHAARLETRCLALQNRPWDLMAWGFSGQWNDPVRSTKTALQLKQEAAAVLSLGGGFQAYYTQNRDGSIKPWQTPIMAEVGTFCRARQVLHKARPVPQIALHYSTPAYYAACQNLFNSWHGELVGMHGVLQGLLDAQHVVDVTMDHHLRDRLADYPLIVVPQWPLLAGDLRASLLAHARAGGSVLAVGPAAAEHFRDALGFTWRRDVQTDPRWIGHAGILAGTAAPFREAVLSRGGKAFGTLHERDDFASPSIPAGMIRKFGKGALAATFFNFGERYRQSTATGMRDYLSALVDTLFPHPMIRVGGSHLVDVTLLEKGEKLYVTLTNVGGPHGNTRVLTFDELLPLGPLDLALRLAGRPSRVRLLPEGKPLRFAYARGVVRLTLPRLDIHAVLEVTPGQ